MAQTKNNIIRIALIGPESTAKSSLAESLAIKYNTVWVKEHSREYLSKLSGKYSLNDVLTIAKIQLEQEKKALTQANTFLFADTELILSKVWCEDVFHTCPEWILNNITPFKYDFYLLTYPDLPWEADIYRENPNRRLFFFDWYEKELKTINANYSIIKGEKEERFLNCIRAIEKFLSHT